MGVKLAIVFPGQGSQTLGMFEPWQDHPVFREAIDEAAAAIDVDLWHLAQHGPAERLSDTRFTQPLMVAAGLAVWRVWDSLHGPTPFRSAGHSVGEISALCAAGAFSLADAARLVRARALAMAEAVPPGMAGMAAVLGLDDATVERLCRECAADDVLEPVNYNAAGQVVVAGHLRAIGRLKPAADTAGAKMVYMLPVSGPFHSTLMQPAVQDFERALQPLVICPPRFDVVHNIDLSLATRDSVRPALLAHLTRPVRWAGTVRGFAEAGITHLFELGPGEVLTNLAKRIVRQLTLGALNSPEALERALAGLRQA